MYVRASSSGLQCGKLDDQHMESCSLLRPMRLLQNQRAKSPRIGARSQAESQSHQELGLLMRHRNFKFPSSGARKSHAFFIMLRSKGGRRSKLCSKILSGFAI